MYYCLYTEVESKKCITTRSSYILIKIALIINIYDIILYICIYIYNIASQAFQLENTFFNWMFPNFH